MKISHFGHLSWSVLGQESLQGKGLSHRGKINCVGRELVNARRNSGLRVVVLVKKQEGSVKTLGRNGMTGTRTGDLLRTRQRSTN